MRCAWWWVCWASLLWRWWQLHTNFSSLQVAPPSDHSEMLLVYILTHACDPCEKQRRAFPGIS